MNLPLCSGGQPITLSVPVEYFAGVPTEAINNYIWAIPTNWAVQGAAPLSDAYWANVSANTGYSYYLRAQSIVVTPPVGQGNRVVHVRFYNRFCYETTAFNNIITGMLSSERSFTFVREPTITAANVPATVTCGDRTPFTPTATASQPGATFSYSVPSNSGWTVSSVKGVVKVTPSGSTGTTLTVTATYTCAPGITTSATRTIPIGFNATQATPTLVTVPAICGGQTRRIFATQVPGATSYQWSGITAPLTWVQLNPSNWFIDVTAPAGLTQSVVQTVQVTAISGYGCANTEDTKTLKAGSSGGALGCSASPVLVGGVPTVCGSNAISYYFSESPEFGSSSNFRWSLSNNCYFTDGQQPSSSTTSVVVTGPASGRFDVYLAYNDPCGNPKTLSYELWAASSINGQPCSTGPVGPRPALYPNPANEHLMLEKISGQVVLYDVQGHPVMRQQVDAAAPVKLDTRALPNGLYYLTGYDAVGKPVRHSVQIAH